MISISKATSTVLRNVVPLGVEAVRIEGAVGRVLAEDIIADMDLPPFNRSQMDGYAVMAADTAEAPVTLKVVGESAAGRGWQGKLKRGQAVRIMTGAPVPDGANAIVKVELTSIAGRDRWSESDEVQVLKSVDKGTSIVRRGAEIRKGKRVLAVGQTITPNNISIPAAFGYASFKVSKRPRVAIMSTGSEIVEIGRKPGQDQIRNSNSVMLKSLAESCGGVAEIFPIAADDISNLRSQISKAAKRADLLIITGGVSVGKYDLTKAALEQLGAEIYFDKVRLKPGKPTVFARLRKTLIFGLPGNPVSSAVTFYLFARMAILQMQKAKETMLRRGSAIIRMDARAAKERDTFLPAAIAGGDNGTLQMTPLNWQGSSDFIGFGRADSLIYLEAGTTCHAGDVVEIAFL